MRHQRKVLVRLQAAVRAAVAQGEHLTALKLSLEAENRNAPAVDQLVVAPNAEVAGSNPVGSSTVDPYVSVARASAFLEISYGFKRRYRRTSNKQVAHLVERRPFKPEVAGSIPALNCKGPRDRIHPGGHLTSEGKEGKN